MAESIGSKIRNVLVGILIGFLVIGFAIWGVSDVFTPSLTNAAASLGDEKISLQEFDDAMRRQLQSQAEESGRAMTNQEAYSAGVHNNVLADLITQKAIDVDATDLGIGVNRRTARQFVSEIPSFTDEITGKFSEEKLNSVLQSNRITRDQFESDVLQTLRRQQTIPTLISGIDLPTPMAETFYNYVTEQRKTTVLTLSSPAVETPEDPGDDVLQDYINTNQARFTAPEFRKITYIRIEPFDLAADITVSEEDVLASFQYRIDRGDLGTEETRSIVQITATSEDTANKVAEQLELGLPTNEIVTGLGLIEPLNYDSVTKSAIVDSAAADAAFELENGKAKAVLGDLGEWLVVQAVYINAATVPLLDDMREEIERDLLEELAQEQLFDKTADIENAIQDGLTLEEISQEYSVPYSTVNYINRQGALQDGIRLSGTNRIPGIATDDTILREIFTADIERVTDLFETSTKGWMAVRVDDIIDPTLRPFDSIRNNALANWRTEAVDDLLQDKMLEISKRADTGEDLTILAEEIGAGAEVSETSLVRGQPDQTFGPRVLVAVLDANIGDVAKGIGARPLTRQIVKVTDIVPNNDGLAGQFADVVEQQLLNALSGDIQTAYRQAIFKENPVNEYPAQIAQALGVDSPN
ncbi:MAG: SurA N-terminal domain-containing protein [Maricaulaceae bacterium]